MTQELPAIRSSRRNAISAVTGAVIMSVLAGAGWSGTPPEDNLSTLTKVAQIRRLTPDQAKRKYPIRLRGVITYHAPEYRVTFFQDETAGIFIFDSSNPQIGAGSLVEVSGNTAPGDFAPSVENAEIHVLGTGPLPTAPQKGLDDLMTGSQDSQWLKVRGVVHSVTIEDTLPPDMRRGPPQLVLEIHSGNDSFKARVQTFRRDADYSRLVDAAVSVRGVCGALFNNRRQLVGVQLFAPGLEQVTVIRAAGEAYARPVVTIESLTQFNLKASFDRRVHIQGVVTLRRPADFIMQDDTKGIMVESGQTTGAEPGDLVDVVGFPTGGGYAQRLEGASFRKIGTGQRPPIDLKVDSLTSSDHEADLVEIGARLLSQSLGANYRILTVERDGRTFTARLGKAADVDRVRMIRDGSQLRLTGVWSAGMDEDGRLVAHQILLRSAADITVIRQAPWITGTRILTLLASLTGVFMLTLLWVAALRRRIREKTETLRAVLESTEDGILAVDSGGRIVSYNHKFLALWRIPDALPNLTIDESLCPVFAMQLKNPDDFLVDIRKLRQDPEGKCDGVLEFTDGRVFERHSEPQRVNGRCVGRVWGFRDVTGRKKAEQRLRSLSAAVEQSPVSIVITDLNGNIEYVNPKFTDIAGYTSEEILGCNPRILKSGATSEEEYRNLWETIQSGVSWRGTFQNRKKNGELYWESASICSISDASGAPTHYLAVKEDISEHELAIQALEESERRYRGLFEHMTEGFAYCKLVFADGEAIDFTYLAVNSAFGTLTGLNDVLGKNVTEVAPGIRETDPGLFEIYARVARTGEPEKIEVYVAAMHMWFSMSLYCPERGSFIAVFDVITERKRAEASLHLTQTAMDQAPFSVLWLDPDARIVYANKFACSEFGYSGPEMLALTMFDFDPGVSESHWKGAWASLKLSGSLFFEARHRNKNGQLFPVEVSARYIQSAGREFSCTFSRNITERKQAEDALRTSQERFRIAAESASDVVFEFDLSTGRFQYYGDRVRERFPKVRLPATLLEWLPMLHADDLHRVRQAVELHLAGHEPLDVTCRMTQSDGSILHGDIHASVTRDPITGLHKSIGVIRDITLQEAAAQANAELAAIVKVTDAAIVRKDLSGRILTWNSGAERMFGYSASEILGQTNSSLLPLENVKEWEAIREALARGSDISHTETVRITKTGERIDIILTASPIRDSAGTVAGAALIAWNITERKRLERQLAQAQKLESIGQLAAGIAHEINTPIQYIGDNAKFLGDAFQDLFKLVRQRQRPAGSRLRVVGGSELSAECQSEDADVDYLQEEVPAAIGQLEEGVAHVARIVRAMKEFSHPGPVEKSGVDINRALDSTILVSRNEWRYVAELTSDFDPELPPVPCVAGEMNQVFLNLIVNAAHAIADVVKNTGEKGAITVSTRRNGAWAEIRVRDTGSGIPEEIRPRVFDPFFTTKEVGKGTGQGLSIAHAVVVQKHQGTIDFESSQGVGTTFLIRLPLG